MSATEATRPRVEAALAQHGTVLVIGTTDPSTGKADGVLLELARDAAAHLLCESVVGNRYGPAYGPYAGAGS